MPDRLELSTTLNASPEAVFNAWLDPNEHAAFIHAPAEIALGVGGTFRLWDGYITGRTLELEPPRKIVQAWRTTDFPEGSADSRLEIRLEPDGRGTRLTLLHSEIPGGQGRQYEDGWRDNYLAPMEAYFFTGR